MGYSFLGVDNLAGGRAIVFAGLGAFGGATLRCEAMPYSLGDLNHVGKNTGIGL